MPHRKSGRRSTATQKEALAGISKALGTRKGKRKGQVKEQVKRTVVGERSFDLLVSELERRKRARKRK